MKKHIALMLVIMLILPQLLAFMPLAADDSIIIKTGAEFKALVVTANFGKTFIIEGTETLADGSTGIVLDSKQSSVSAFYGTLRGVDGKNNIQISKPLFTSIGLADTGAVVVDNIILKGSNADGTGEVSYSDNAGALIVAAATNYPYAVTISNVTNYVDVTSTGSGKMAGGILGYVRYRDVTITNCVNYGDVDANNGTAAAGGIVGRFYGASSESANISHCVNYGDVTSSGTAGGIVGRSGIIAGSVTYCANYGNVTCTATTKDTTGAAGICFNSLPTSKCFNAGNVSSATLAGGIMGTGLSSVEITDCFNVGSISSTSEVNYPAGIVGSYSSTDAVVTNSYNAGALSGSKVFQIGDTKTDAQDALCTGNYYISDTDAGEPIGTNIASSDFSASLPSNFDENIWEILSSDVMGVAGYTYPQLKNNWYDHKFRINFKEFANYRSETSGLVSAVASGWNVVNNFNKTTSIYSDINTATVLSNITYPGIMGATLIATDSTNTSSGLEFTVNKSAEIILAVNKNPETNTIAAIVNGGFKPVEFLEGNVSRSAGLVTADGEEYFLYKKLVLLSSGEETISIDAGAELEKGYAAFVNWIDTYTLTFTKSGNEIIKIDGVEKTDDTPVTVVKGTFYNIEITPEENYYIKSVSLNNEKISENIVDSFTESYNGNKNLDFTVETSCYSFVDSDTTDDKLPPSYIIVQGLGAGNTVIQTLKVEGKMEEFLAGETVSATLSKESAVVYEKTATIEADGSIEIVFPLIDTDTGLFDIAFKVTAGSITSDIVIDDSKKTYEIPSVADVNELLLKLNNDNMTADEFTAVVLEEKASLPFEVGVFKYIAPAIQNKISTAFIAYDDFTIDNIYSRFDEEVILKTANNSENSDDFKRLIDVYGEETGIKASGFYTNYEALLAKDPEPLYEILKGRTYTALSDILDAFEFGAVFAELSNITSYDSILEILNTYRTFLDIDAQVTSINNMVDSKIKIVNDEIGKALKELTTKALLKDKLENLILNADKLLSDKIGQTVKPVRPPVSGGGGGGGGGSSIAVSKDFIETETVDPIPTVESINDFNDIGDVPWAQDSIRKLLYDGIVRGKESGKFYPNDTVTRAEFVKMAVMAFDLMEKEPECNFKDVPKTHWSYDFVGSAQKSGIISGYSKDEFGVDGNIKRQDVIAILIRVTYKLGLYEKMEQRKDKLVTFTDESEIADYAMGGVNMLSGCGIIAGYADGSFGPEKELTRAEAATILARYIEFFEI